ncbi:kinase-like protein [Serendipita vermifera]|nr:kinase-like protein [Serendipita vermifera]
MDDSSWDDAVPNLSGQLAPIDFRQFRRGGYANVYPTTWKGDLVAVKVLCPIGSLQSMRRKIHREGLIWSKLNHPNILPLLGFADDDKGFEPFGAFVSPWCSQGNSEEYLAQRGDSMSLEERLDLLCKSIEGATYLHLLEPPIVHGDIKPANILVDQYGVPKLCDFGLSSIFLAEGASGLTTTTAHTGTERYLAPELVMSVTRPTRESDVYAMGCVGLKFTFLINPYDQHPNNVHHHIIRDIIMGVPPAKFNQEMDTDHETLGSILNNTWCSNPSDRLSMPQFLSEITMFDISRRFDSETSLSLQALVDSTRLQVSNDANIDMSTAPDPRSPEEASAFPKEKSQVLEEAPSVPSASLETSITQDPSRVLSERALGRKRSQPTIGTTEDQSSSGHRHLHSLDLGSSKGHGAKIGMHQKSNQGGAREPVQARTLAKSLRPGQPAISALPALLGPSFGAPPPIVSTRSPFRAESIIPKMGIKPFFDGKNPNVLSGFNPFKEELYDGIRRVDEARHVGPLWGKFARGPVGPHSYRGKELLGGPRSVGGPTNLGFHEGNRPESWSSFVTKNDESHTMQMRSNRVSDPVTYLDYWQDFGRSYLPGDGQFIVPNQTILQSGPIRGQQSRDFPVGSFSAQQPSTIYYPYLYFGPGYQYTPPGPVNNPPI